MLGRFWRLQEEMADIDTNNFLWLLCVNIAVGSPIQQQGGDGTNQKAIIVDKDVFGSLTAYRWVYNTSRPVIKDEYMTISIDGNQCEAIHITLVSRHGSRYPITANMRHISKLIDKLKENKGTNDFRFLESLTFNYPFDQAGQLIDAGKYEEEQMGKRYAQRLNKLLKKESLDQFEFLSSGLNRAKESAKYFFEGMTEILTGNEGFVVNPAINDNVISFYSLCDRYKTAIVKNDTYPKEWCDFNGGPEFSDVKSNLELRLGFSTNNSLTLDEVHLAHRICAFEMNIDNSDDWCSLFTEAERKVLEYASDLKSYYTQMYGDPLLTKMACPLIRNIFLNLDEVVSKDRSKLSFSRGRFLFGHEETLMPVYAALNLFKDTNPLLATNMVSMANRKLRGSRIMPMAGNMAMVMYKCNRVIGPGNTNYAVRVLINEEPVFIPACSGNVCSYEVLRANMSEYIDMCDHSGVCSLQDDK